VRQPTMGRVAPLCPRLGHPRQRAYLTPAFLEEAALFGDGDGVVEAGAGAEVGAQFIVCRTEAGSGAKGAEPTYGVVALLDATPSSALSESKPAIVS